jgi:hypothetical protein
MKPLAVMLSVNWLMVFLSLIGISALAIKWLLEHYEPKMAD